jgi:F0F1-type ATP synthase assembly protein I
VRNAAETASRLLVVSLLVSICFLLLGLVSVSAGYSRLTG